MKKPNSKFSVTVEIPETLPGGTCAGTDGGDAKCPFLDLCNEYDCSDGRSYFKPDGHGYGETVHDGDGGCFPGPRCPRHDESVARRGWRERT